MHIWHNIERPASSKNQTSTLKETNKKLTENLKYTYLAVFCNFLYVF